MAGALSKRQQARNEKALQDLVQNVPGNNICADCHARNPSWASWSLGVFLCMRCAAIHRKLGTHISKIKSLSMDSWTNEQVDNMRKVGNVVSNKVYNPEGKKPPVPVDADEVDSAMERFIRQKYMNNTVAVSRQPSSPRSDEGVPPPLPPKNTSKFGLRSASSLFPLTSRSKKDKALPTPDPRRPSSHGSSSKPSQLFGASVNFDDEGEENIKLARLRDMGFQDQQRNTIVLRGVNGNLERAIESLVRLGEGDRRSPAPPATLREPPLRATRSMTPLSTDGTTQGAGASLHMRSNRDLPPTPSSSSTNPFDTLSSAQPQTAQSTGSLQNNRGNQSWNPFDVPRQQTDPFGTAFQRLDISSAQQQQPLFPNRTGGLTPQTQDVPSFPQPPLPTAPLSSQAHQFGSPSPLAFDHSQAQLHPQQTGYNPFLTNSATFPQQPPLTLTMPHAQTQAQRPLANNPFARSPTRIASPTSLGQIPEQSQTSFPASSPVYSPTASTNPFFASPSQSPVYGSQTMSPQSYQYFQPQRHDKASIMALYSSMKTEPQTQSLSAQPSLAQALQPQPATDFAAAQVPQVQQHGTQMMPPPSRSMTEPLNLGGGNNNPFTNGMTTATVPPSDPFQTARQASRESVNLGKDLAWTNGRHSPDAFASLSARHR